MSWNAMTVRNVGKLSSNGDCPGGKQSCPDSNTCCQLQSGDYGCCPYPQVQVTGIKQIRSYQFVIIGNYISERTQIY